MNNEKTKNVCTYMGLGLCMQDCQTYNECPYKIPPCPCGAKREHVRGRGVYDIWTYEVKCPQCGQITYWKQAGSFRHIPMKQVDNLE